MDVSMKLLVYVAIVVGVTLANGCVTDRKATLDKHVFRHSVDKEWTLWKQKYAKVYATLEEEKLRKSVWLDHYKVYSDHMVKVDRQYEMEMNEFSDQILPRSRLSLDTTETDATQGGSDVTDQFRYAPDSWDWRDHGVVTPVKSQGMTGNVVSMVATESVESYAAIHDGYLMVLSTVETKICCVPEPLLGLQVFMCLHNIGGLCAANTYPATPGPCRNESCTAVGKINGGQQSPNGDEKALMAAVAMVPVMAGIDASHTSFQLYTSGVYSEPACSSVMVDHAVQIVGYGSTTDGQDYWICRNSWGVNWGMKGYVLIARNKGNMCGIATAAFYPV